MWLTAMFMAAMAGPNGLQALHNPQTEQTQQQVMVQRLGAFDVVPEPSRPADPNAPAQKRAAAWRADHLSCSSRRGRTADQYRAECGAWLADEAEREPVAQRRTAAAPGDQPRFPIR
jgi:hypothetical protein